MVLSAPRTAFVQGSLPGTLVVGRRTSWLDSHVFVAEESLLGIWTSLGEFVRHSLAGIGFLCLVSPARGAPSFGFGGGGLLEEDNGANGGVDKAGGQALPEVVEGVGGGDDGRQAE